MREDNKFIANCMTLGCHRDTYGGSRGMCTHHYAVKQAQVKRGATTWEKLEATNQSKPKLTKEENSAYRSHRQRSSVKKGTSEPIASGFRKTT